MFPLLLMFGLWLKQTPSILIPLMMFFPLLYEVHAGNKQQTFLWYVIYNIFGTTLHVKQCSDEYFVQEKTLVDTNRRITMWCRILLFILSNRIAKEEEATNKSNVLLVILVFANILLWWFDESLVDSTFWLFFNFGPDLSV